MSEALPFIVFGAFFLFFFVQARREGLTVNEWMRRRNAATSYTPGWWKPMAVLLIAMILLFIAVASATHGFRWDYLLAIPILGGFFVVSAAVLSWFFRRQFGDRQREP
jgi:peptidoglycan/LPS O-acetylase OafA/YrhL